MQLIINFSFDVFECFMYNVNITVKGLNEMDQDKFICKYVIKDRQYSQLLDQLTDDESEKFSNVLDPQVKQWMKDRKLQPEDFENQTIDIKHGNHITTIKVSDLKVFAGFESSDTVHVQMQYWYNLNDQQVRDHIKLGEPILLKLYNDNDYNASYTFVKAVVEIAYGEIPYGIDRFSFKFLLWDEQLRTYKIPVSFEKLTKQYKHIWYQYIG